jgi:HlyD family secretion protein
MSNLCSRVKNALLAHKIITVIIIVALGVGGYFGYQKFFSKVVKTQYVTQKASLETISTTVTGSGQISELDSLDLTPETSGTLTKLNVKKGDQVKSGQVLAVIDQRSAAAAITSAKANLQSAQASYQNLVDGATQAEINIKKNSVTQAENNYNNAILSQQHTLKTTETDVAQAQATYDDLEDTSSTASPTNKRGVLISTIDSALTDNKVALDSENKIFTDDDFKTGFGVLNSGLVNSAKDSYNQALVLLQTAQSSLAAAKNLRTDINVNKAVNDAVNSLEKIQTSLNYSYNALQNSAAGNNISQSQIESYKSSVNGELSTVNSNITSIQNASQSLKDAITSAKNSLDSTKLSAESQVASAKASVESDYNSWQTSKEEYAQLIEPATTAEINSALASISSAKVNLQSAQDDYDNTTITAQFDGQIASLSVSQGNRVSAGSSIGTLITNQYVAVISLNEVDMAKIKVGNPATMTFDAVDDLTLTGKVVDIDTLGTVSSGVVTYDVKISLDAQDSQVKPGMSTSATIITETKTDVLAVPNAAVKSQNSVYYVQKLNSAGEPENYTVETGFSDDTYTEIISGISEGDSVVTQTVTSVTSGTSSSKTKSSSLNSLLGGGGGRGF